MKRSEQREHIFKMIFCIDYYSEDELSEQMDLYIESITEMPESINRYIRDKANSIIAEQEVIDKTLSEISEGWKIGRLGKAELSILRLAIYEIQYDEDIPTSVAINEAVELAKIYGADQSAKFVNGILAKLA